MQSAEKNQPVRIDKFLWAIRVFKTRTMASDACRIGRILVNGLPVKPSRDIVAGEVLTIKKPPVTYTIKIKRTLENRVAAKLVNEYIDDITPDDEKKKLEAGTMGTTFYRKKGTGRPTKKERRIIDRWQNGLGES